MLSFLNERIFGAALPAVLVLSGLFFLIRFRFYPFRKPVAVIRTLAGRKEGRRAAFRAACVALSGTLGVGNIAGVAAAVSVGGAGSVFWMWVCGLTAMVVKYAEVVTAMSWRKDGRGGTSYYMEYGLKSRGAGCFFAVILLISSFGVGNIVQSSAAAEALSGSFAVPKLLTGAAFAALTFLLIRGGIRRLTSFSAVLIPILTLGYVLLSAAILIVNHACLPSVLRQILAEAFSPGALIGGGSGFAVGRAVRYGASRGLLSNEAGCGTAAYAHASSGNEPVPQGLWGIVEVFVDTILLCTATAFVVLIAAPGSQAGENGMATAIRAYGYFGDWGGDFIALSSALYALASVVCWSYYGIESLNYLIRDENKSRAAGTRYLVLYSATGIAGAMFAPAFVWELSDCLIAVMALFNMGCLCLLSGCTARETRLFFAGRPDHSGKPRSRSAVSRSSSGRTAV